MAKKAANIHERVNLDNSKGEELSEILQSYVGQPLAILCARFNYRGILSKVGQNFVVLAQARAVESSGASSQERPSNEDPIGSSVIISVNSIELIYQPNWCFAALED
jgi:hypothetical protein